ncbi:hypothetical protein [Hymenobacter jeollabukensis]|uniref:Lipoprotein n=1 Tax=Hymenobacter jeollabukensis TaxID=2025313 RepID=A0A5R8WM28_9BACT|nr:hypothetical protein [Hymenobacter jeollabukensis]TLM90126.1 hypothetical protein FDY95_19115 [Hymenobacter jeollabukensis]
MLTSSRVLSAALLLLPLAACDNSWSPGVDHTNNDSFARAPRATRVDTERDSVSGGGKAYRPIGTGSMARSTAEAISSQPGGDPNTSKYTESGTGDGTPGSTPTPSTRNTDAPRQTKSDAAKQPEQGTAPQPTNQPRRANSAQN